MVLTAEIIYQWTDEHRPFNLAEDLDQLWDDISILNTFLSTRAYVNYIVAQTKYLDYERDNCSILLSEDGLFKDVLSEAVREIDDEEIENLPICTDTLISYFSTPLCELKGEDWINTGLPKYVPEAKLKEFIFYYLECIAQKEDIFKKLPENFESEFKRVIKPKIYETLIFLAR